jgi:hypothetical protein
MFSKFKSSFSPSKKPASADSNDHRRRNRLSKPPTNSSSMNLNSSSPSLLLLGNRNSILSPLSTSADEIDDHSPSISNEPAEALTALPLILDTENPEAGTQRDTKLRKGAAYVVSDIETQRSTSPAPRSPIKSPLSTILSNSRLSLLSSKDYKDTRERTPPKTDLRSGKPSREDLTLPIPIRRKSLSQPGIATRTQRDERLGSSPAGETEEKAARGYRCSAVIPEETNIGELETLHLETPRSRKPVPPPLIRTETPADLVFLGGLKLGSLHVTNGRVSPAPSDLSRRAKARSTPNLRLASSEYGDSEWEDCAVEGNGTPNGPSLLEVPPRFSSQAPNFLSPLRFSSDNIWTSISTMCRDVGQSTEEKKEVENGNAMNLSPDRSTSMAEDYMAELPPSPFEIERPSSTTYSILDPVTKSTEFDDNLFEAESVTPSESESVDDSTVDTNYSSAAAAAIQYKQSSSPQESRPAYTLADSGYSSNSSLRGTQEEIKGKTDEKMDAGKTKSGYASGDFTNTQQSELTVPKKREDRKPGPRPLRPSILKQAEATATSLPIFENLHCSTTTLSTVTTATSMPPTHKGKRLRKPRLLSRSSQTKEIIVQGNREVVAGTIPPVPAEFTANLAIRSEQVPELDHTFETRQHTAGSPTDSQFELMEIRFPSPAASVDGSDEESSTPPRPPVHRQSSFARRSRSFRRSNVHDRSHDRSHDLSEADALAVIQDFGTVGHSLGGNPYDAARTHGQPNPGRGMESARKMNPHNITTAGKKSQSVGGMDAETAAELARMRSRTIYERDCLTVAEKRESFNDRGGLPGKNLRPMSFAANTPPLPALPAGSETYQRRSWAPQTTHAQSQQSNNWWPDYDGAVNDHNMNMPAADDHSGYNQWEASTSNHDWPQQYYSEGYPSDFQPPENERRNSWRSDRVEIDFDPSQGWTHAHEESNYSHMYENNSRYDDGESWSRWQESSQSIHHWMQDGAEQEESAPPPPPHSPRPRSVVPFDDRGSPWAADGQSWQARNQSADEALQYANDYQQFQEDSPYPQIPPRNAPFHPECEGQYDERAEYYHDHQYAANDDFEQQAFHGSYHKHSNSRYASRPHSQANSHNGSYAGSLAESLHPPQDPQRVSPSPQFGRYSGGFSYGYEHGFGFGGSAGTRSVSGVAGASRKGKHLSEGFGVDLSDVPIIAGLKKL